MTTTGDDAYRPAVLATYVVSIDVYRHLDELKLTIRDDGVGFDYKETLSQAINEGHIGQHSMRERASELGGQMAVISRIGEGTEVTFSFPSPVVATSLIHA